MTIPTLKTDRLTLRPLSITDLDDLFLLRSDASASNFVDSIADTSKDQTFLHLIKTLKAIDEGQYWKWAIDLNGKMIGTIAIWNHDRQHDSAEFGYTLRSPYRGYGYMSESLETLIDYGHTTLNISKLYAYTEISNERSNRLLPKLGFIYQKTVNEMGLNRKDQLFHYNVYLHASSASE